MKFAMSDNGMSVSLELTQDEIDALAKAAVAWAEAFEKVIEEPDKFVEDCLDAVTDWAEKKPEKALALFTMAQMGQTQTAGFSAADADSIGGFEALLRAQGAQKPTDPLAMIFGENSNLR